MDCNDPNIPASLKCIPFFFNNIIAFAMALVGSLAVFFIVLSGIKFLTSGGDPSKVEGAKKSLTYAIVGLVIILMSFVVIKVISTVTGVECQVIGIRC